jgi:hypothetical protein
MTVYDWFLLVGVICDRHRLEQDFNSLMPSMMPRKPISAANQHGVSFVSVTQQFNTTTSMGRSEFSVHTAGHVLRGDASEKDHRPARSCDDRSDLGHCDKRFCPTAGVAGYRAAASTRSARAEQRPNISSAGQFGQPNPFSPAEKGEMRVKRIIVLLVAAMIAATLATATNASAQQHAVRPRRAATQHIFGRAIRAAQSLLTRREVHLPNRRIHRTRSRRSSRQCKHLSNV